MVAELVKENKDKEVAKHCLFTYFNDYINNQSVLKSWSEEYISSFKYEVNKWRNFHQFRLEKLKREAIESGKDENNIQESFFIEDITEAIIIEYIEYLKNELNNEVNTIYKSNKRSRQIFNHAQKKDKIITGNPYEDVKLVQIVKTPTHLTANELKMLECLKQKLKRQKSFQPLLNILNYFLFACYTGLRYQTLESLSHKEVYDMHYIEVFLHKTKTPTLIPLSERAKACLPEINPYSDEKVFQVRCNQYGNRELKMIALMAGIDKRLTHHKARHKTNTMCHIPIIKPARNILDKYASFASTTGKLLPVLSNQKMNAYLKEIATIVGIKKELTTHTARCNFCTLKTGRGQHPKYLPYAFTELGVSMLSSVLHSEVAVEINISIMRAFVAVRQLIANPPIDKGSLLQREVKELKEYMEEAFADQNDINEDTRIQIELINQTLAELQIQNKEREKKPRPRIRFIRYDEDSTEK